MVEVRRIAICAADLKSFVLKVKFGYTVVWLKMRFFYLGQREGLNMYKGHKGGSTYARMLLTEREE